MYMEQESWSRAAKERLKSIRGLLIGVGVLTFLMANVYFTQADADEKAQITAHGMSEGIQYYKLAGKESNGFFPVNSFSFTFMDDSGELLESSVSRQNYQAFSIGDNVPCVSMGGALVPVRSSRHTGMPWWDNTKISTLNSDGTVNEKASAAARALLEIQKAVGKEAQ